MRTSKRTLTLCSYFSLSAYGLTLTIIGPALDHIQNAFNISSGETGFLFFILSLGFIFTVIFAGYFTNTYSLKTVSILGQVFLSFGLLLFAFSNTLNMGVMAFFIIGAGGGLIEIATNTIISTIHSENRASSLNMLHLFFGFGALFGPAFSGYLIQTGFEWRMVYIFTTIYSFIISVVLLIPRFPEDTAESTIRPADAVTLLKNRYMQLLCLATIIYVGIEMAINNWAVIYMEKTLDLQKLAASSILSYFWFAMTFGRIFCVYLSKYIKAHNLFLVLSLLACGTYGLYLLSTNVLMGGITLALVGLSFSGMFPILIALTGNRFPDMIGISTSILMTSLGVGLMVFPWLTGIIADLFSLQWGMKILWCALVGLLLLTVIIRQKTSNQE